MTSSEAPDHLHYLSLALSEAKKCEPAPTAFCVGAVLVSPENKILSTGYSRELPGNTHAEQCCFEKLSAQVPEGSVLYTTMEPCSTRLSGNKVCVDRILENPGVKTVVVGVKEPTTFVKRNVGEERLVEKGVKYVHVSGLEKEILEVAERGHEEK